MKLYALATAATVALATSASAMAPSQLEIAAQKALDQHGFTVDASDLSLSQWVSIRNAAKDSENDRGDVRASIAATLRR